MCTLATYRRRLLDMEHVYENQPGMPLCFQTRMCIMSNIHAVLLSSFARAAFPAAKQIIPAEPREPQSRTPRAGSSGLQAPHQATGSLYATIPLSREIYQEVIRSRAHS